MFLTAQKYVGQLLSYSQQMANTERKKNQLLLYRLHKLDVLIRHIYSVFIPEVAWASLLRLCPDAFRHHHTISNVDQIT